MIDHPKSWQQFEEVVAALKKKFHKNATVTRNDHILGVHSKKRRQIDVSIRYQFGPTKVLIVVECKRLKRKVTSETMDAFIGKMGDVRANVGIVVSEKGFTDGSRNLAEAKGVEIYTMQDTREKHWPADLRIQFFVEAVTLNVFALQVLGADGTPIKFEPGEIVHLHTAKEPAKEVTLDDFVRDVWSHEGEPDRELCFEYPSGPPEHKELYRLQVGFRPEFVRFSRAATFECIGLMDAQSQTTYTDAFKMVARQGGDVHFFNEPEFWNKSDALFGVRIRSVVVKYRRDDEPPKNSERLNALLPKLRIEISAKGKAMQFKLERPKVRPLARRISPRS